MASSGGGYGKIIVREIDPAHSKTIPPEVYNALPNVVRVDKAIEEHVHAIVKLKNERNQNSIINQIPPEILTRVFAYCITPVNHDLLYGAYNGNITNLKSRISFSHVCHHWRVVALATPSLWSSIPLWNANWTMEMLARCKSAPLSIIARTTSEHTQASKIFDIPEKSRTIQELQLTANSEALAKLLEHLSTPMPTLVKLHLCSISTSYEHNASMRLPPAMFAGEAPQLGNLHLDGCIPARWDCFLFHGLTDLTISGIRNELDRPTFDVLCELLSHSPQLCSLTLKDAIDPQDLVSRSSSSTIDLPRLTTLNLAGTVTAVTNILLIISWPPEAKLQLKCNLFHSSIPSEHVSSLISAAGVHYKKAGSKSLRSLSTRDAGVNFMMIDTFADEIKGNTLPTSSQADISIMWDIGFDSVLARHILNETCKTLPTDALTSLFVYHRYLNEPHHWKEAFDCVHIRAISLQNQRSWGFLEALAPSAPTKKTKKGKRRQNQKSTTSQPPPTLFLPKLRSLSFKQVNFSETLGDGAAELAASFRRRALQGAKLRDLKIEGCSFIDEEDVDRLRKVIPRVDWDNVTDFVDSQDEDEGDYHSDFLYDSDSDYRYGHGFGHFYDDVDDDELSYMF